MKKLINHTTHPRLKVNEDEVQNERQDCVCKVPASILVGYWADAASIRWRCAGLPVEIPCTLGNVTKPRVATGRNRETRVEEETATQMVSMEFVRWDKIVRSLRCLRICDRQRI